MQWQVNRFNYNTLIDPRLLNKTIYNLLSICKYRAFYSQNRGGSGIKAIKVSERISWSNFSGEK